MQDKKRIFEEEPKLRKAWRDWLIRELNYPLHDSRPELFYNIVKDNRR